jgi:VanZ family protein
MDDPTLAKWQSEYKQDEPEWRLAEHEWQRRLTAQQIKATMDAARWQAWFRILAVVIGALLGTLLTLVVQAFSK